MAKLTAPMRHCLLLLEVQDGKRGWVRQGILKTCGVTERTLTALRRAEMGMIELDIPPNEDGAYNWRWRLSGRGEREAARLKKMRLSVSEKHIQAVTGTVTESVTETEKLFQHGRPLL